MADYITNKDLEAIGIKVFTKKCANCDFLNHINYCKHKKQFMGNTNYVCKEFVLKNEKL